MDELEQTTEEGLEEEIECLDCMDTGEVRKLQYDSETHEYYEDGSMKPCHCRL